MFIFDELDRDSDSNQGWYQYGWYLSNLIYNIRYPKDSQNYVKKCT